MPDTPPVVEAPCPLAEEPPEPTVTIAPERRVVLLAADAATTAAFTATGDPGGGTYSWAITETNCEAAAQGATDEAAFTVSSRKAGTTTATVTYTTDGGSATATAEVVIVAVTIAPKPGAVALLGDNAEKAITLTATGVPADLGAYAWALSSSDNESTVPGAKNRAAVEVKSRKAGTAKLKVTYTVEGKAATAEVDAHFVGVAITDNPLPELMVRLTANDPNALDFGRGLFHARGTPANGVYKWPAAADTDLVRYINGVTTVSADRATLEGTAGGDGTVKVEYKLHEVTAKASATVTVQRVLCSAVSWLPAGASVTPGEPLEVCTHENGHYYGGRCDDCSGGAGDDSPRWVRHWVPRYNGAHDAVDAVVTLAVQLYNYLGMDADQRETERGNRPWLNIYGCADYFQRFNRDTGRYAPTGKMIGVLLGANNLGQLVRLRAISGTHRPQKWDNTPNPYWSPPLADPSRIPSVTRGTRYYPNAANHVAGWETFGKCAATALLSHARLLGLRIHAMAELFLNPWGTHNNREPDDRDIIPSCDNCRRYLGRLLCEYGGGAR